MKNKIDLTKMQVIFRDFFANIFNNLNFFIIVLNFQPFRQSIE